MKNLPSDLQNELIIFEGVIPDGIVTTIAFHDEFFKKVEEKTKVNKQTILELANDLNNGNMKDESTLRKVIQTLEQALKEQYI